MWIREAQFEAMHMVQARDDGVLSLRNDQSLSAF